MADPFISQQDLSDYLGQDVTEDEGALAAVDAACEMCRNLASQTFNQVIGETITLDGAGTDALVLPEMPVTNAGTVTVAGGTITNYELDTTNGVLLRTAGTAAETYTGGWTWGGWIPFILEEEVSAARPIWPKGRQLVTVTYDHGYAPEDLPRDVRMVALSIASRLIVQGPASEEQIGEVKVKYGTNALDFTAGERLILSNYRRTF